MKKSLRKNILIKGAASLFLATVFMAVMVLPVQASTAINVPDSIQFSGNLKYLAAMDNYYVDLEKTDIFESGYEILNNITNVLFSDVCWIGKVTSLLFYYCMKFDLAELLASQINSIQGALNSGIFKPLFYLGFCGAAFAMIKNLLRRNAVGIMEQIGKILGVLVLSMLLVSQSSTVLSYATGITKGISVQILISMQGSNNVTTVDQFAIQSAGAIWVNMVHQPWLFIEFGNDTLDEDMIDTLLDDAYSNTFNPTGRADIISDYSGTAFKKGRVGHKLGFLILYLVPMALKCVIYIVLAVLTLGYQLFAVFYVLIAPVILILVMFPGYEHMMGAWLRKLVETQLGILILSFVLGLIIMVDNMLFSSCSAEWGWFLVVIVQTVIALLVIVKRNELLNTIGKMQRAASVPRYARAMMIRGGNGEKINRAAMQAGDKVLQKGAAVAMAAGGVAMAAGRAAGNAGVMVGKAVGSAGVAVGKAVGSKIESQEVKIMASQMGTVKNSGEKVVNRKNTVVRPVMSSVKEQKNNEGAKVHTANTSANASEPQKRISRPRMDKSKIIPEKSVDGRIKRAEGYPVRSGRYEARQVQREGRPKLERPVAVRNTEALQETKQKEEKSVTSSREPDFMSGGEKKDGTVDSGARKARTRRGQRLERNIPPETIVIKAQDRDMDKSTSSARPQMSAVAGESDYPV